MDVEVDDADDADDVAPEDDEDAEPLEVCKCRCRSRVGQVVGRHIYGLY